MKKNHILITYIVFIAVAVLLLSIMLGLLYVDKAINTPPSFSSILEQYNMHCTDICVITNYLKDAPYKSIYITDLSGSAWADFSNIQLEQSVLEAVERLIGSGYYIQFIKRNNIIWILQWKGLRDVGCGIAYSLDRTKLPSDKYLTELHEIKDGWYYYISAS